ncbi:MAG TPA: hypothetical protein VMD09_13675 [Solirubrobacteraceae bacterium]|nr:hypothetical protein [Solirubrobacteraceae bacterium]
MSGEPRQRAEAEPAHDVLAAEAFAVPAADPDLRRKPVVLPEDPSGLAEPHDILAAEEFAMPAARSAGSGGGVSPHSRRGVALAAAFGSLLALLRLRRRR